MQLKDYLRKHIDSSLRRSKEETTRHYEASQLLDGIDLERASYKVDLISLWAREGEKSTTTNHRGSLEEAIINAESRFKRKNHRTDVQADYFVTLRLGQLELLIPESYYRKYAEKH